MRKTVITIIALFAGIFSFAQSNVFTVENNFGFGTGFLAKVALKRIIPAFELPPFEPTVQDSLFYLERRRIRNEKEDYFEAAAQDALWFIEALPTFSDSRCVDFTASNASELWCQIRLINNNKPINYVCKESVCQSERGSY